MPDHTHMSNSINRDEIVRLTTVLSALVDEVKCLTCKVEELKDDHVVDLERGLALVEARHVDLEDKLCKLQDNITWLTRTVVGQAITLIGGIILWWVKLHG